MKVAVIGVGYVGKEHARLYAELPDVELAGVVDVLRPRAEEVAALYKTTPFTDYREILGKVDAATLAVPTIDHGRIGIDLLENGVDVLVEKPIASSLEEGRELIDRARRNRRVLQVGHVERFNPVVAAAREAATRPQFFEIHRLAAFSPRSLDVDVVLDLMIHDIDIVLTASNLKMAAWRTLRPAASALRRQGSYAFFNRMITFPWIMRVKLGSLYRSAWDGCWSVNSNRRRRSR